LTFFHQLTGEGPWPSVLTENKRDTCLLSGDYRVGSSFGFVKILEYKDMKPFLIKGERDEP
jgi:hypothetical protein